MFPKKCNINKTDRINRVVIGMGLFLAALLGMSKVFFMVVGLILAIEGLIGWCSIPYLMSRFKQR